MPFFNRTTHHHRYISHTVQIPRCLADVLVPLADRLFADTIDGAAFQYAIRPFFLGERPRTAILKGDDIWIYLEGPVYEIDGESFPMGAQMIVSPSGWLSLGPVEAAELHAELRKVIDATAFRWLIQKGLLGEAEPTRPERDRKIDDTIALRQMAAAAGLSAPESEASHG